LRIRNPYWAEKGIEVKLNDQPLPVNPERPGYVAIRREWKSGDKVDVRIPMSLRLETMPDNPKRAAIMYGPLVLAGELGPVNDPAATRPDYVPVLIPDEKPLDKWLKPVEGQTNTFRTHKVGKPRDVMLYPFYRMHDKRYTLYWDLLTEEEWETREAQHRAEQERLRKLEARTVDMVQIGEGQSERDHNLQGERTSSGELGGRKWRHATDGGWFSFAMKVLPDVPIDLLCTYWGSDSGERTFDVLLEGNKVATQTLNNNKPGQFFDVAYPLSEELTRGKDKVTVRFQAHPGKWAGGLFGCRTTRRADSGK
jgi:hypothetical protein